MIILFNPYTYNFLKGLTHSAVSSRMDCLIIIKTNSKSKRFMINDYNQSNQMVILFDFDQEYPVLPNVQATAIDC